MPELGLEMLTLSNEKVIRADGTPLDNAAIVGVDIVTHTDGKFEDRLRVLIDDHYSPFQINAVLQGTSRNITSIAHRSCEPFNYNTPVVLYRIGTS